MANDDRNQVCFEGEVRRVSYFDSERGRLLVSGMRLKRQLRIRSEDSQEVESVKYRLDGVDAKERWAENTIKSLLV